MLSETLPGPVAHYKPKTRSYKNTPVSILWTYLSHKRWIWSMPAISERSSFTPPTPALAVEAILKAYVHQGTHSTKGRVASSTCSMCSVWYCMSHRHGIACGLTCRRLKEGFHVLVSENGVYLLVLELYMRLDGKDTTAPYADERREI